MPPFASGGWYRGQHGRLHDASRPETCSHRPSSQMKTQQQDETTIFRSRQLTIPLDAVQSTKVQQADRKNAPAVACGPKVRYYPSIVASNGCGQLTRHHCGEQPGTCGGLTVNTSPDNRALRDLPLHTPVPCGDPSVGKPFPTPGMTLESIDPTALHVDPIQTNYKQFSHAPPRPYRPNRPSRQVLNQRCP